MTGKRGFLERPEYALTSLPTCPTKRDQITRDGPSLDRSPLCPIHPSSGFGFIQPSDSGKDIFVHITAVQRAGPDTLREGQLQNNVRAG